VKIAPIIAAAALFLFIIPFGLLTIGLRLDPYIIPCSTLEPFHLLGIPILITGTAVSVTSIWQLYSFGAGMPWGDVADDSQSSKLVKGGLYSYTRNPMLLGFGLFIMGVGLYCSSFATAFILSILLVTLVSIWIKRLEEPKLAKRFEKDYIEYRENTPFIIPITYRKKRAPT